MYAIVRGSHSGVFAGEVASREGREVSLNRSRRIWYWSGAATLSEMATRGVMRPHECRFPAAVAEGHLVLDAVEVIPCTEEARKSIEAVPTWTAWPAETGPEEARVMASGAAATATAGRTGAAPSKGNGSGAASAGGAAAGSAAGTPSPRPTATGAAKGSMSERAGSTDAAGSSNGGGGPQGTVVEPGFTLIGTSA